MKRILPLLFIFLGLYKTDLAAQIQNETLGLADLPDKNSNLQDFINTLEEQTSYFVSFNPRELNLNQELTFPSAKSTWDKLLKILQKKYAYEITVDHPNKKILLFPSSYILVSGIVRDSASRETLPGVSIYSVEGYDVSSNDEGFFHIKVKRKSKQLIFSYPGYQTIRKKLSKSVKQRWIIEMGFKNNLPEIVIEDSPEFSTTTIPIDTENDNPLYNIAGIGGDIDLISQMRTLPGISIGYEGQTGFIVRGGGPDQNLVLLDGLPIFETSHLGGLTSIFVDETIKKADLYKGGVPARFGGKLSSVLDIRLKDGDRIKHKRKAELGLERISGFMEGPLSENTSYIFNGRASVFGLFASPIIESTKNFQDTEFAYRDVYGKLSHWFSPSHRISFSFSSTYDNIQLTEAGTNTTSEEIFDYFDTKKIQWDNRLFSINWKKDLSDKVFMNMQAGVSSYFFNSTSELRTSSLDMDTINNSYIRSVSCHDTKNINIFLDWYTDKVGQIKTGIGLVNYISSPSILEQENLNQGSLCGDSTYRTNEVFAFLEESFNPSPLWSLNLGVRGGAFVAEDTTYCYLQPRLNINYQKRDHSMELGYSQMNQFLHLLVNPSSGLPSDLWVPSTRNLAPETSDLVSVNFHYKPLGKVNFSLGAFYNRYDDLLEYANPTDLIQALVLDQTIFNFNTQNTNWEERVISGSGQAYGVEFELSGQWKSIDYRVAYTLSRSERTFVVDRRNQTFPFKYDRPHNLFIGLHRSISEKKDLNLSFHFGNGARWTLPDREEPLNPPRIVAGTRNNVTLGRYYHHLDINYTQTLSWKKPDDVRLSLGIYNLLNKKNPFYGYVVDSQEVNANSYSVKEISLFPIFPQINISYGW